MAYIPVPKDLSKVKTKVALNLTLRQLICFSIAAVIGIPIYFLTRGILGNDIGTLLMVIAMFPFFFIAMYEKDGFSAEKILYHMVRQKILNPGLRPYKTDNLYTRLDTQIKLGKEIARLEAKASRKASKKAQQTRTKFDQGTKKAS